MLLLLAWVPVFTSLVMLATSWIQRVWLSEGSMRTLVALTAWFTIAAYLQFFGTSLNMTTTGLVLQSILAFYLLVRLRLPTRGG